MSAVTHFIANNPVLLGVVIFVIALIVYSLVKKLAKLALFLVVLAVVAWFVMRWLH